MGHYAGWDINRLEAIALGLATSGLAWVDDFLAPTVLLELHAWAEGLRQTELLKRAAVGAAGGAQQVQRQVRGDWILWLDPADPELNPTARWAYFSRLQTLMQYLNDTCYTALHDLEAHLSYYPPGAFYRRHVDRLQSHDLRRFSLVLYLNPDWRPEHGGRLQAEVQSPDNPKTRVSLAINPLGGRLVVFDSRSIPHQVERTLAPRYSLTAWLRNRQETLV